MVHINGKRLTQFLALALVAVGASALTTPAYAQDRFRVLVPKTLQRTGDIDEDFGEDVNKELKELIDELPTHMPVDDDDLDDALDRFRLEEEDIVDCVTARQLAAQSGYELVLCGKYSQASAGFQVEASFINPSEGTQYDVEPFTAREPEEAAAHILGSFQRYLEHLGAVVQCNENLESQNWSAALERCDAALAINQNAPSALYGRGYALMQMEQHAPAMEALQSLLKMDPFHEEGLMAAGFLAAKMGDAETSRRYYNEYLQLNPDNAQVRLRIAADAATAGDPEGALQIVEAGLATNPDDMVLVEYAVYFAAAAAAQAESAAPNPEGENGGDTLAPTARSLYEKTLEYGQRVYAARADSLPDNFYTSYLGALNKLGRTQEAADFGGQAVQRMPESTTLWSVYAQTLKNAGRLEEALAALDTLLVKDPSSQMVYARKGSWVLEAGDMEAAIEAFRMAVERGELTGQQAANQFLAIGINERYQAKDYDGAIPFLETALEFATEPQTQGLAHFYLGYILYLQGEQIQNASTLESARKSMPIFQRAMEHFQQARPYAEANSQVNLNQFFENTQRYIDIQDALIRRGG